MTALNYFTIAASLFSIVLGLRLVTRPSIIGWQPRTSQIVGATMAILTFVTIVLTLMQSHGKA